ncbi:MAG TPA: hypothetical protein VGD59_06270 [Acidisarcina sp.]
MSKPVLLTLVCMATAFGLPPASPTRQAANAHLSPAQAVNAQAPDSQPANARAATHSAEGSGNEGEAIFKQQCSRCHNAPDGFSPRISGTVLRHMRVRASLSRHDEQELLRFLNP